jgi:hypothetical protein
MPPKKYKRKRKPKALLAQKSKSPPLSSVDCLPLLQQSTADTLSSNTNVIDHKALPSPITETCTSPTGNVNVLTTSMLSPSVTGDQVLQASVDDANATMTMVEEISAILLSLPVLPTTVPSAVQPEVLGGSAKIPDLPLLHSPGLTKKDVIYDNSLPLHGKEVINVIDSPDKTPNPNRSVCHVPRESKIKPPTPKQRPTRAVIIIYIFIQTYISG